MLSPVVIARGRWYPEVCGINRRLQGRVFVVPLPLPPGGPAPPPGRASSAPVSGVRRSLRTPFGLRTQAAQDMATAAASQGDQASDLAASDHPPAA